MIAPDELAALQQAVLAAVLGGQPLAGAGLPDLAMARHDGAVALADANLAPGVDLGSLPAPVRLTRAGDTVAHLAFRAPDEDPDGLGLTLEVRASPGGAAASVPLSALRLRYVRRDAAWTLAAPPAQSSN